jgi:hypothetical protein
VAFATPFFLLVTYTTEFKVTTKNPNGPVEVFSPQQCSAILDDIKSDPDLFLQRVENLSLRPDAVNQVKRSLGAWGIQYSDTNPYNEKHNTGNRRSRRRQNHRDKKS